MTRRRQDLKPVIIGLALAASTLLTLTRFSPQMVIALAAILLAIIAAIYIGFAIADGRGAVQRLEIATAVLFIMIALAGLWVNPWLLVLGYIGHGIWDWLHHANHIQTEVVGWYPPFCAIYDIVVAIGLIFWIV